MSVSVKVSNIKVTFDQINEEYIELINQAQRISAFAATGELTEETPVDTGRARSSWFLSKDGALIDRGSSVTIAEPLGPVPKDKIEALYITNGTPYIQDLNAGSSTQAPARFIEKVIAKYFEVRGNFVTVK